MGFDISAFVLWEPQNALNGSEMLQMIGAVGKKVVDGGL